MKTLSLLALFVAATLLGACTSAQRTQNLENRLDRQDARVSERQQRMRMRGERADARNDAFFDNVMR